MKISVINALEKLNEKNGEILITLLQHGTMSVEMYRPIKTDLQSSHKQDEIYVIISGSGRFFMDGSYTAFTQGDVLFVPAGIIHRFVDFTDDFATWVIFYGPEGGEHGSSNCNKYLDEK